jgi:DNA-binding response OmpR family regulator
VSQPTVLVVDDSDCILHLLEMIFSKEGFRPRLASSGLAALALARAEPPDAVLLDVRMPEMDGWEVLCALRQDGLQAPVVMTSTADAVSGGALALARGAQGYLMKPFSPAQLVEMLRELLAESQAHAGPAAALARHPS